MLESVVDQGGTCAAGSNAYELVGITGVSKLPFCRRVAGVQLEFNDATATVALWLTEVDQNALDTLLPARTRNRMKPKAIAMRILISAPASR